MKRKRTFVLQETERRGVKGDDIQTTWRLQPDTKPPWHSTSTDIFPVKPTSTLQHITDRRLSPYHLPTKGIWPIEYRKTTRALTWSFYVGRSYIQYIGCFLTQKVTRIHYLSVRNSKAVHASPSYPLTMVSWSTLLMGSQVQQNIVEGYNDVENWGCTVSAF